VVGVPDSDTPLLEPVVAETCVVLVPLSPLLAPPSVSVPSLLLPQLIAVTLMRATQPRSNQVFIPSIRAP